MRIVHLSDVHVSVDYRRLPLRRFGWRRAVAQIEWVGMGRAKRFAQAFATLERMVKEIEALRPDHVVLSGDLTALAVEEEFQMARKALAPIARREMLSVIPGNHDRYTAHAMRERRFEKHFGDLLASDLPALAGPAGYPFVRLVGEGLAVVGLDSTRLAPLPGLAFGSVGAEQLDRLARILEAPEVRERSVAVLVHHAPLHDDGHPDRLSHGLIDGGKLLDLLARPRCTLHHGHVHHRYWHRATRGRPDVFNAGSSTQLGSEGYWVVDVAQDGRVSASVRAL